LPPTEVGPNHSEQGQKQRRLATTASAIVRWATTPPQAIAVYLVVLGLVAGLSFYVGTLKPKHAIGLGPPPASVPR
jgi:hypothetical protein